MLVLDRNVMTEKNSRNSEQALRPRSFVGKTESGGALLEVELPGFSSEEVSIDLEGNRLRVTAHRESVDEGEPLICERNRGDREAVFEVGDELDTSNLDARMQNGILSVRFEQRPERKPRQIKIKRG